MEQMGCAPFGALSYPNWCQNVNQSHWQLGSGVRVEARERLGCML